jgi:tRNA-specific 2-thiouridylase
VPVREMNWLGPEALVPGQEREVLARVRSTREPKPAILRSISATEAIVELLAPEDGVSPGQACVLYDPDSTRVLGGGWIWSGNAGLRVAA